MIKLCQNNCGVEIEASNKKKYCEECGKLKKKESIRASVAKWFQENKESIAERKAKWFQENKERVYERQRKYYQENKERLRERKRDRAREYRKKKLNSTNSTTII